MTDLLSAEDIKKALAAFAGEQRAPLSPLSPSLPGGALPLAARCDPALCRPPNPRDAGGAIGWGRPQRLPPTSSQFRAGGTSGAGRGNTGCPPKN